MRKIFRYISEHQFGVFVVLSILIALGMTIISLVLYSKSGAIKLDLSRPGYEHERKEVERSTDTHPFNNSAPLTKKAVNEFTKRLDKYQDQLRKMGNYSSADIEDSDLNLTTSKPATTDSSATINY